jgi:cardiolipin synthase
LPRAGTKKQKESAMKKLLRFLNGRLFYTVLLLVLQGLLLYGLIFWASVTLPVSFAFAAVSVAVAFWLVSGKENPGYKILWLLIVLTLPFFGVLLYWIFGNRTPGVPFYKRVRHSTYKGSFKRVDQEEEVMRALEERDMGAARQAAFIVNATGLALYKGTQTEFFCPLEPMFEKMVLELGRAQKYIFLEFFTIREGVMWNTVLDILKRKAKEGLDIRVIYDDMGTIKALPAHYDRYLESLGIGCVVFNPMIPILSVRHNNRNHRKVCVIDGRIGYTGGFNLSDEYINAEEKYGHWVDSGIEIRGKAVKNLLVPCLAMWNFLRNAQESVEDFLPEGEKIKDDGFVLPYTVDPYMEEDPASDIYINMIFRAKSYVYINTPYFIIDYAMEHALTTAAISGVDVRICFPGVPDKFLTHLMSKSYFPPLLEAGVKVYAYPKGFIHSKTFVCDDETAIVGSINLDYRSLFLHFENAVWMYGSRAVLQVKEDFEGRLAECRPLTPEDIRSMPWYEKALCILLKPFAPLF